MSQIAYTLLMFGCADDGSACEKIAAPTAVYSAAAACEAQAQTVLNSDPVQRADYPVVEVRCVKVSYQASARSGRAPYLATR